MARLMGNFVVSVAAVLAATCSALAGDLDAVKRYESWLASSRNINLSCDTQSSVTGASPVSGTLVGLRLENVTRVGDVWTIQCTRQDYNPTSRKMQAKRVIEYKVDPKGSVLIPRTSTGQVDDNIVSNPKLNSESIAGFLSSELGFLFGYAQSNLSVVAAIRRGVVTEAVATAANRPVTEVRSSGQWGECQLTLDHSRGFAPLKFRQLGLPDNLVSEGVTLSQRPVRPHPYYLSEPIRSVETLFEVAEFADAEATRVKSWKRTVTTTYTSGQVLVWSARSTASYTASPAIKPGVAEVPAGTSAVVANEKSGVEYEWDGEKAVPRNDRGFAERVRGVRFSSPWVMWVAAAVLVLFAVSVVLYRVRRGR